MSELLSREQEFLKLNEELNVKTKTLLEKPLPSKENRPAVNYSVRQLPVGDTTATANNNNNINKLGKPPIKPRVTPYKANTVPRNIRPPATTPATAPLARSTPKGRTNGNATFRVVKEEELTNSSDESSGVKLESGSDTFSVYEIYKNENFEILPSVDESTARSEVETLNLPDSSVASTYRESSREGTNSSSKKTSSHRSSGSSYSNEGLPKKNLSSEGLIKFLKSKVSILQTELETSSHELTKKAKELEKAVEMQKRVEAQRDHAISRNNNLTGQVSRLEAKLAEIEQKLKEREVEFTTTSRDMESIRRELRLMTQQNTNLEKRLYRANEELENVKNTMTLVREADRQLQDTVRKERDEHFRQTKTLKKQRSELLNAYKKQLYLLDNLKRQTVCLEQARLISFAEKEFTKVLEWNAKN